MGKVRNGDFSNCHNQYHGLLGTSSRGNSHLKKRYECFVSVVPKPSGHTTTIESADGVIRHQEYHINTICTLKLGRVSTTKNKKQRTNFFHYCT